VYRDNDLLLFERFGPEGNFMERYHTWRYIPIIGVDNRFMGIFNQSIDTTETVLAERRLGTVRELSEHMLVARTAREYYTSLGHVLSENRTDVPFFLCYSVDQQGQSGSQISVEVTLETSVGVPENHPSAPNKLTISVPARSRAQFGSNADRMSSPTLSAISALSSGSGRICHSAEGSSWPILKALATRQCVIVDDCRDLIRGYPVRQWDRLPNAAIVVPICGDSSLDIPEAVMILGLNARRPFDADYDNWVHVIRAHLASSLTSVKANEAESKRLEDNARMEKAKSSWFRGAAHDLRSPLTLISGPLDDVLDSTLSPNQRSALTTAKRNVDRLMRLVNALMDFSRLEAGRVEGRFVPTDLGMFVSELAAVFRPAVERMKIGYIVEIQPSEKLVYIDPTLFETVVSNLIGNALKYTESGSITVRLTYDEFAKVSVIDTGVGIPREELGNVSEWFHRASTAIHSGTQGTGLGLALAKELLHLHDGELLVSSKIATENNGVHGSVFTAQIPLTPKIITTGPDAAQQFGAYGKAVATEALRWVRDADADSSSDAASESQAGSSRLSDGLMFEKTDTILLVDDNMDMREYIKTIFSSYCKVIEATNGEEALEIAIKSRPDLILSDFMMPKMNGLELLTALREHERTKIIPFIMLSAVTGDDARVDALIMGAEDYLPKPFKPKELLARGHLHLQVGKKRAKLEKLYAEREMEIALLSDYCPSGIMRADSEGSITYVNRAWRECAGLVSDEDPNTWIHLVEGATMNRLLVEWKQFLEGDATDIRMSWKWTSTGKTVSGIFVRLDLVSPGMSGILGCLNDISYEEERLLDAEKRRIEAEESRHQQELLIDLTSHEIRTPVSAILQCSSLVKENVVALYSQLKWAGAGGFKPTKELLDDLEEDIEALESEFGAMIRADEFRHLPVWFGAGTDRRRRPVACPDPA
jgi:signal transduction histidine kinase/CheY-like chemotaxis protein